MEESMADIDLRKLRYFVAVPELLLVLAPPLLEPLLEQAANATRAATEPTAPNVRSLNGRERVAVSPVPWNVPPPAVRIKNLILPNDR